MWVVFVVAVVAGLAVLGLIGWRLFGQVRSLGRTVVRAGERVAAASADLDRLAPHHAPHHAPRDLPGDGS